MKFAVLFLTFVFTFYGLAGLKDVLKNVPKRYDSIVGYSGHERGVTICTASIPLGGRVIERHFTLDRTMKGPDHAASIEPTGLELICKHAKQIFSALGESNSVLNETELINRKKFRGY